MHQISFTPPPVFLAGIALVSFLIVWQWLSIGGTKGSLWAGLITLLAAIMLTMAVAAIYFTAQYRISSAACLTGIFGGLGGLLVMVIEVVAIILMLIFRRQIAWPWLKAHSGLLICAGLGQFIAWSALMRSALMCTV